MKFVQADGLGEFLGLWIYGWIYNVNLRWLLTVGTLRTWYPRQWTAPKNYVCKPGGHFLSFFFFFAAFLLFSFHFSPSDEACETEVNLSKFSNDFFKVKIILYCISRVTFHFIPRSGQVVMTRFSCARLWNRKPSWKGDAMASSSLHAEFSEVASVCHYLHTTFPITYTLMVYREMHKSRAPGFCSVAHGVCGSSVWNLPLVTFLAPGTFLYPWCTVYKLRFSRW